MGTQNLPGPDEIELGRVGLGPNYYGLGMVLVKIGPDPPIEDTVLHAHYPESFPATQINPIDRFSLVLFERDSLGPSCSFPKDLLIAPEPRPLHFCQGLSRGPAAAQVSCSGCSCSSGELTEPRVISA
jgi:hypothetical protein